MGCEAGGQEGREGRMTQVVLAQVMFEWGKQQNTGGTIVIVVIGLALLFIILEKKK